MDFLQALSDAAHEANGGEGKNLWVLAGDGDLAGVTAILDGNSGVGVSDQDDSGYSALHAAASWGRLQVAQALLQRGARVDLVDDDGDTPLHFCETVELARLLIEAGADPAVQNGDGKTAAETALEEGYDELVEFYAQRGDIEADRVARFREEKEREEAEEARVGVGGIGYVREQMGRGPRGGARDHEEGQEEEDDEED